MALNGLPTDPVQIPFVAGLDTKAHQYAVDPPGLTRALNVEFDEVGGLRLRKPYASIGSNIYGGGSLSSVRKIVVVGDELLCFTSTTLYSWSPAVSAWISKGTHVAVATSESTQFANTGDQAFGDRAQLSGVIVYVWTEVQTGAVTCYLAAIDATTGAVLISPTAFAAGDSRPRVVALATKILVTWRYNNGILVCKAIDPAAPAFSTSGSTALSSAEGDYDIEKDPAADAAVYAICAATGSSYEVGRVTAGLSITGPTAKSRDADEIAIACSPNNRLQIIRFDSGTTSIIGDLLNTTTLVDVNTSTAIGTATTCDQLTGAFRSVTDGGYYRCYVFWSSGETTTATDFATTYNWINTNNATGTEGLFLKRVGPASRAFDYGGQVYLWTVFACSVIGTGFSAQMQNTCYLYRDDAFLTAKAIWQRSGGFGYYTNHLPGVALVSGTTGYAWCGVERQTIELVTGVELALGTTGYATRAPRDVLFTFDSDDARRVVQLGRTAYVSGGLILQYDGEGLTEVGFEQYPWFFSGTPAGSGGSMTAGEVSYKETFRWLNARGEGERSTSVTTNTETVVANDQVDFSYANLHVTKKLSTRRPVAIELWRTAITPTTESPYYLVTSKDPAATGDNGYIYNVPGTALSSFSDAFSDTTLATKEEHPENDGTLPRLAPPAATILAVSDVRLFLAGVAGEPYRVWYSLLRSDGEIVGFNSTLSFELPTNTGPITALWLQSETLIVATASAIYAVPGDGYGNVLGGGSNYGPPRLLSTDVGVLSHDTVALTPGGAVFFSRKGWYRLPLGGSPEYIGAPVEDYNTDTWVASQVVESQHQVRFLSSSRMLVWDYLVGQWAEWSQSGGKALARWRTYPMLLDSAVKQEQSTIAGVDYLMDVETGWIKPAGMQGFARVRRIMVLGEYKNDHKQRVRVTYDYGPSATDDSSMSFSALTPNSPTKLRQGPSRQRIESIKIRITIYDTDGVSTPTTNCVVLTGLALEVGLRRGLYPRLPAAQKQ